MGESMAGGKSKGHDAKGFDFKSGELLLTGHEAAEVLGVTPRTCATWARTGKLFALRIGGGWRYPERAVRELAEARERGA
jgi:excisionase family DNA binding protein